MSMAPQSLYCGKEAENRRVLSLVLNVRRHCEDVTSDGRLFQVLAAAPVHGHTGTPARRVCTLFAPAHEANADGKAAE